MTPTRDRRLASTLARGLCVLRAFRPTDDGLGNQQISERTGLPRPTVSRLTFTLCALGYLTHGRKHDKYRLGPAALALGNIAAASFSIVEAATPAIQRLADTTGTLIGIAIPDDERMLLAKTWRPTGSASIWLEVGYRLPILGSSSGKAYLAALEQAEFDRLAARLPGPPPYAPGALARQRRAALHDLESKGFTGLEEPEHFSGRINAVALPFRAHEFGGPVVFFSGASSDAVSTARMWAEIGPALAQAVAGLRRMNRPDAAG